MNPDGDLLTTNLLTREGMAKRLMCGAVVWLCLILQPGNATAQEAPPEDSLKSYDLSEIVIGGQSRQEDRIQRVFRVDLATIARQDVPDVASTLRLLPSTSVQTNSRGETLVYIRSAGERQVAVFLDGAPLNIAWDNRIDLSLVPA
ncbi:MAG: TonB-dependent receptor plug domain-containing protein, partial [Rhodothermales bacterium]